MDPDRWIESWDGRCFVRKVQRDTSISIDERCYYVRKDLVGHYVTVRIEVASRSFVVEHAGIVIKQIAIRDTGKGPMPFSSFVEQLCT